MKIFLTNLHSRKEMLVANSIANELYGSIEIFDPINIYDIYLSSNNDYIVLSEDDSNDLFISKFVQDLTKNSLSTKKNKIIFLFKNNDLVIKHKDIISIPYDTFYHYNEYTKFDVQNDGYILCELNCISQKKNSILDNIIYPENTQIPVKLVNCPRFDHPQNLGVVNDYDMLRLISKCSAYIGLTDNYIYDAINMKKPALTTVNNKILPVSKSLNMSDIANLTFDETHTTELQQYKISNIIKYKLK
jgi:hypothetical protein